MIRVATFLEPLLILVAMAVVPWLASAALDASLAAAALRGELTDPGLALPVEAAFRSAAWQFVGGGALVALARAIARFRPGGLHVLAPFSLPAAYAALGLGFVVQVAYGSPLSANWPAPAFASGVLYAGAVAAAISLVPAQVGGRDLGDWLARGRWVLLGAAVLLFLALGLFGTAPGASGQTINLWGFQPIEIVKVCVVLSVGATLGARAFKLRWHRDVFFGWFRVPRLRILAVALGMMAAAWLGLLAVRDFGPTLILALVFLGLVFVVTRSPAWVLAAVVFSAVILIYFRIHPDAAPSASLALRVDMWRDPWLNGRPNGDQLALARWALAAGGPFGSGVGAGVAGALPAGHTDLVYAHLVEVLGLSGAGAYLVLLGICVLDGLRIAAHNRTPERVMMAAALGLLIAAQATVILGGTLGWFPLTGVVVPFLSFGKTGSVALVGVVALLVRLGDDGHFRADTEELRELRGGVNALRVGVVGLVIALWVSTFVHAMVGRDDTTLRGLVTTLGDGTPVIKHDPRLTVLARKVRRGSILDRGGEVLAASPAAGARVNPMGDQLGTVLGTADSNLARAKWQVEQMLDTRLRGWPNMAEGKHAWVGVVGKSRQVVFATEGGVLADSEQAARATARLGERGGVGEPARVRLADPDYSALLPIARMGVEGRVQAITTLANDVESRSVRLSIDGQLQALVATATRKAASKTKIGAAAIVVLDTQTGEVLARAQWPDFDPGGTAWRPLRASDETKFMGVYGPWSDKTGAHGVYQAGSVFKTLSALVAVREGVVSAELDGDCPGEASPVFPCNTVTEGRTSYTLPGWSEPIHDFGDGGARGDVDLVEAITRSSNVYFGQLALKLGPSAYRRLREEGVEFGNPGLLAEKDGPYTGIGEAGSRRLAQTGFGQGAASWSVMQAARLVAAVANGGNYLRCPASMELGATCPAVALLPPGTSTAPILAGMKGVVDRGTAARLAKVPGVRLYAKTGTADAPGTKAEVPWGIKPGKATTPHSWLVAIAEGEELADCAAGGQRYAIAAVVPHGGFGASAAGPLVIDAVKALQGEGYLPPPTPPAGSQ